MAGAKPGVHVVQLKAICVPEALVAGQKFIKWDDDSTFGTPVTLKVDKNGYVLFWTDQTRIIGNGSFRQFTQETTCLDIAQIRDIRTGVYARTPKDPKLKETLMIGDPKTSVEEKSITICHGQDFYNISFVNFVGISADIAMLWTQQLMSYSQNLLALNGCSHSFLEKAYTKMTVMTDKEGRIPIKSFFKLFATHKDDRKKIELALQASELPTAKSDTLSVKDFTFEKFFQFYKNLVKRVEIEMIFQDMIKPGSSNDISGAKKKPYLHLTVDKLVELLNSEQRDPRLNEILYPYYNEARAQAIINQFEPQKNMRDKGCMSEEGFLRYLLSEDNNIIDPQKFDLSEDMDQPLAHYFINSSHNTYLTGHQLTGKSSVEMYRQVLLSGCRCIELDCWDGKGADEEPIITHGFTMCTEVVFKDVVEAITESAFKTSDYPVILSFENHCSPKQQAKMAAHCRNIFGDLLLTDPLPGYILEPGAPLPSPELLKRKIIVKNKKRHYHKYARKLRKKHTVNDTEKTQDEAFDEDDKEKAKKTKTGQSHTPELQQVAEVAKAEIVVKSHTKEPDEGDGGHNDGDVTLKAMTESDILKAMEDDLSESDSDSESDDDDIAGLTEEEEKRRLKEKKEKGTAGKEAEAGLEMSLLVNYVQPVHFHSFEISEKRNHSYEISSFVETQGMALLKDQPVDFVNYNKRQLSRIYPKGTRVDSGNYMPQVFWNAGCQLVALNFQTLDLAMQINLGQFEFNGRSGYILKPDFMRRPDRHFDPFAESTVDGIIAGTVEIKVISGQLYSEKRLSTYVEVEMYGLPADTVRKKFKTKLVPNNSVNPIYNDPPFVFKKVVLPNLAMIRILVSEESGKLIGHRLLPVEGLRPGYRHISLRNEANQPLPLATLFVHITVKDYVPDSFADFAAALSNPIAYQTNQEKHTAQLSVLTDDFEVEEEEVVEEALEFDPDAPKDGAPRRTQSLKPRTNSVRSVQSSDSGEEKKNGAFNPRLQSSMHASLTKRESDMSSTSQGSGGTQQPATSINRGMSQNQGSSENGGPAQTLGQRTKLNDPDLVTAIELEDLKESKQYQKSFRKMTKELEILRKKHEKARQTLKEQHKLAEEKLLVGHIKQRAVLDKNQAKNFKKVQKQHGEDMAIKEQKEEMENLVKEQDTKHRDLKRAQTETFVAMQMDQYKGEIDLYGKYHDSLYDILDQVMKENFAQQHKKLEETHDKEVADLRKRQDAQSREDMKGLSRKHKDKSELARVKREAQQKYIQIAVAERQKFRDLLDRKKEELEKSQKEVQKECEEERKIRIEQLKKDFDEKCRHLKEQFRADLADEEASRLSSDDES
ncbi:1-phosphatidylinositol 4,5-bisphosphate phosphodiesterase beta-1-like isoform X2 [Lineus longissimus]|uniref:1-phosphatidylinositol 4,5-bisphosphate phosphodiesterase beta-1-like isoform X2 n=1 Tax=Lineus longissimus TaxID=88925 RepID=UPI00315CA14E